MLQSLSQVSGVFCKQISVHSIRPKAAHASNFAKRIGYYRNRRAFYLAEQVDEDAETDTKRWGSLGPVSDVSDPSLSRDC